MLDDTAFELRWLVVGKVWATGERCLELEALADSELTVTNHKLVELACAVTQVIDGEFVRYKPGETEPWVIIRAIDSTYYEFICRDKAVLDRARDLFGEVTEC